MTSHAKEHAQMLFEDWHKSGKISQYDLDWLYETAGRTKYLSSVPELCRIILDMYVVYVVYEVTERISQ